MFKSFSNDNEDILIEKILNDINFKKNKIYFVELGTNGDLKTSNVLYFKENYNSHGVVIDHDEDYYSHFHGKPLMNMKHEFIIPENINKIFEKYNINYDIDLLSIQINGMDFWILYYLDFNLYNVKIICININNKLPNNNEIIYKYDKHFIRNDNYNYGCNCFSLCKFLEKKNYYNIYNSKNCSLFLQINENTKEYITNLNKNNNENNNENIEEFIKNNKWIINLID